MSQAKGSARWALAVFGVLAAASVPIYLALARGEWFLLDEWDFLADRTAWNLDDLLRPHTNHWTALPILVWRALWTVAGVRSYVPYVLVSVLAHVAVAALARAVMRRCGVDPWIATVVAGVLLFFGAGAENIMYAFQITFTGAIAFGFAHLLLADHDGPIDRRDWLGLLAGLLGLLCSGVAVAMVVVVGVAALLRRGWRIAAFHTVPLGLIYVAWWARYARSETEFAGDVASTLGFVRRGITSQFGSLGQIVGVGALVAVVLVVGLALLWQGDDAAARRRRLAMPVALIAGALVFLVMTGLGRTGIQKLLDDPGASRYQYVGVALLMPAIAVAIDALFRRWPAVGVIALVLLLVGVPGNISEASRFGKSEKRLTAASQDVLRTIGRIPRAERVPGGLHPDPSAAPWVTMAWLRSGIRSGRIPALSHPPSDALLATDRLRLSLMQVAVPRGARCPVLRTPVDRVLARGDRLRLGNGVVTVGLVERGRVRGFRTAYGNALLGVGPDDHELVALVGPLRVRIAPTPGKAANLC